MTEYEFPLHAESPPETPSGRPPMWVNPDIPQPIDIVDDAIDEFECPYPGCPEPTKTHYDGQDPDEYLDLLEDAIESNGGTLRCDECNEPLLGFYANGDHDN